ncbi:MAG: N-acetylmuramoyl-L-alanine amidase [Erysipelotrichaceae bacterium]|nr:N-acetylmuramoyl-L-alanine amidase [Erysipelotrichaceae bacterium]MCI9523720.1 N-acetylmuramoyl-L-alanine amidase [Erysipelotrichaceae bacterium]
MTIKIFIDQGHNPGNINAGASGNGLEEQAVNFTVGSMLADLLDNDPRFAVRTSRMYPQQVLGNTTTMSLQTRVHMANYWDADYFISIHSNSNTNPAINGSEVYVYRRDSQAWYLGEDILSGIVENAGTRDNQVRVNPALYVLRATRMPAVLVELGYLSNSQDAQKLLDDPYSFAYGIYVGLLTYLNLL